MALMKTQKRKKEHEDGVNLKRVPQQQDSFRINIIESQRTGDMGHLALADTLLICNGGTIRTHAFILQAASSFFHKAIYSQGENYPYIREIMLPDFSVNIVEKVLELMYKGHANLKNQEEIKDFQETLQFFDILGVNQVDSDDEFTKLNLPLQVSQLNRIPEDIGNDRKFDQFVGSGIKRSKIEVNNSDSEEIIQLPAPRTSSRLKCPVLNVGSNEKQLGEDEFHKSCSSDSSVIDVSETESSCKESGKKRLKSRVPSKDFGFIKKNQPVIKLKRLPSVPSHLLSTSSVIPSSRNNSSITSNAIRTSPKKTTVAAAPNVTAPASMSTSSNSKVEEVEVETDEEDKDWETPNYKNKAWLMKESHRCQMCNKDYEKHSEALTCITQNHKAVRCYFCFKAFSATDVLFRHFSKRHKPSGRSLTTMCHFCDSSVPFKSVSCHVISTHLKTKSDDKDENTSKTSLKTSNLPGRPCNSSIISKTGDSAKVLEIKSAKSSERKSRPVTQRRIPDLNITLKKYSATGKVLTFHIQKKRNLYAVPTPGD